MSPQVLPQLVSNSEIVLDIIALVRFSQKLHRLCWLVWQCTSFSLGSWFHNKHKLCLLNLCVSMYKLASCTDRGLYATAKIQAEAKVQVSHISAETLQRCQRYHDRGYQPADINVFWPNHAHTDKAWSCWSWYQINWPTRHPVKHIIWTVQTICISHNKTFTFTS